MLRSKYGFRAVLLCALAACSGDMTAPTAQDEALSAISDGAHGGSVPGFYFLPPMAPPAPYSGTFDAALQPRVEICQLAGAACGPMVASYSFGSGSGSVRVDAAAQHYIANWNTPKSLDPAAFYRVQVFVGTFRLGYADVDVVRTGKEKNDVDQTRFVPVIAGQTLPVKFRIETGIAGGVVVSPATASVAVGGTQQFTATVTDLHGNPIPGAPAAWSSSATAVATVDASGLATGRATGQATITATSGAASGSATLTVFNPNTPPVAAPDTFQAIGNVTVPVAAPGVLANDTDAEGNALSVVAGTYPTTAGGSVVLNADGSFTYRSAAGFAGTDSFTYTVTDGQESVSASAAMVSAYRVWYVDNAAAGAGDGRDASPFTALSGAEGASATGETILLRTGAGAYGGGIALKSGQSLTGQGVASDVTAMLNGQTLVLLAAGAAPTVTRASGTTVQVAANNVVQGLDVASAAGAGMAGSGFGTLTVAAVSVTAQGGPALDLSAGSVAGSFTSLSSAGSPGSGIRLVGVGGSFSAVGGAITGAGAAAVDVMGGAGSFSYGGSVAAAGPLAVSVTGRTGGALVFGGTIGSTGQGIAVQNNVDGSIAFTGASKSLSTGANPGVLLSNNGGAKVSFGGGGLAIATTSGAGFYAANGGTVTVTGAGNSVVSTGGAAVHVQDAAIGAAGLSFVSVSATGGAHGIVLVNTGSLNGMQVTGSGAAASGGSIRGMTSDGVRLESARNVILSFMDVRENAGNGVYGNDVADFRIEGSTVVRNGDAAGEAGLRFGRLVGSSAITNTTVAESFDDNVRLTPDAGVLTMLSVVGSSFLSTSPTGGNGFTVLGSGTAQVMVVVSGSTFGGNRLAGFLASSGDQADQSISIATSTFRDNGVGVDLATDLSGDLAFGLVGNTLVRQRGSGVSVLSSTTSTNGSRVRGTITGNQVGDGTPDSGSRNAFGISVDMRGDVDAVLAVTNNTTRNTDFEGILVQSRLDNDADAEKGRLDLTLRGNTVGTPDDNSSVPVGSVNGTRVEARNTTTLCMDIAGNSSGSVGAATQFRVRQRETSGFQLERLSGAANDALNVGSFIAGQNAPGSSGSATLATTYTAVANGTCRKP
ncbi:Ig-like domain-containing protein [Longimicrobium sp.]|jgi:hypothetical protein|uniref:Ig-like domain-containing protein n=1 Tax=Longimicrobium sp. TaxID=2029185 RepID=UPI002F943D68